MKLQDKTVLITGAAKRIGREIALTLAKRGADIVIHYYHSERDALKLKKEIESIGADAYLVKVGFSPVKGSLIGEIRQFVRAVFKQVRTVDVLINNAAIFFPSPLNKVSEGIWDDFININLKAPFFLSQEFGIKMTKQKSGKIINLVDWTALRPSPRYVPYAISKAGLISATNGLAKALAPHVQVACIAPGPILPSKGMSQKEKKKVIDRTLLKRFGHPRDIAQTVRFFIEDTDYMTGVYLPVDGGASLV